jgi:hypothetical protein
MCCQDSCEGSVCSLGWPDMLTVWTVNLTAWWLVKNSLASIQMAIFSWSLQNKYNIIIICAIEYTKFSFKRKYMWYRAWITVFSVRFRHIQYNLDPKLPETDKKAGKTRDNRLYSLRPDVTSVSNKNILKMFNSLITGLKYSTCQYQSQPFDMNWNKSTRIPPLRPIYLKFIFVSFFVTQIGFIFLVKGVSLILVTLRAHLIVLRLFFHEYWGRIISFVT